MSPILRTTRARPWGPAIRVAVVGVAFVVGMIALGGDAHGAEAGTPAADPVSLQELIKRGGPLMWPLGLCSIVAFAFAVERFLNLRPSKVVPRHVVERVDAVASGADAAAAATALADDDSAAARIVVAGLRQSAAGPDGIERAMGEVGRREVSKLRDNIMPLNLVANIAPLIGLLGTVFGMIHAFKVVAAAGTGKPDLLATGIYQALITTAAGLSVAIPSLALYYWFNSRVVRNVRRIDELGARVVDRFRAAEPVA